MDSSGLKQQLIVALDDLDQSKAKVRELKTNLKDVENFIQTLKEKLSKSKEKKRKSNESQTYARKCCFPCLQQIGSHW